MKDTTSKGITIETPRSDEYPHTSAHLPALVEANRNGAELSAVMKDIKRMALQSKIYILHHRIPDDTLLLWTIYRFN